MLKLYAQTLETMKEYPKHRIGISRKVNGHNKLDPFCRVRQGPVDREI